MSGRAGVCIGVALAAALALAAVRAAAYVPLDLWARNDFTDPVTISPVQAYRFVRSVIQQYGGLPPDARLHMAGGMGMLDSDGSGHRMSYQYLWYPAQPYWFNGVRDVITAQVVSEPHRTCLNHRCTDYLVTYEPHLQSFMRTWHPAWWRAELQERIRSSASFVPPPSSLRTSCPGGVDVAALRRVVGSARHYLIYGGMHYPVPALNRELAVAGTSIAAFSPVDIAQEHNSQPARATRAIVTDTPPKNLGYRTVWLYVANPWPWKRGKEHVWLLFASDDLEPTCKGALPAQTPMNIAFSDEVLAFDDLAADAVYRSTEEARRRTRNAPHLRDSQLLAVSKTAYGASVRTKQDERGEIWMGTFTYDRRGALTRVEYRRL